MGATILILREYSHQVCVVVAKHPAGFKRPKVLDQGPVVRRVDNFIQRINPYPVDKIGAFLILIGQRANFIHWTGIYPLDKVIYSSYNWAQNLRPTTKTKTQN